MAHPVSGAYPSHHPPPPRPPGLVRTARRIQPDVDPLGKVPRDVDVVILEEGDSVPDAWIPRKMDDRLDDFLAGMVLGVGLPGEEDLDGAIRVREEPDEPLRLTEQEPGALVRREPTRDARGERLGPPPPSAGPT